VLSRNSTITIVLAAVLAVSAGIGLAAWYRGRAGSHAPHTDAEYFCPMHPSIVRDKPGECPICGMKLEQRAVPGAAPTTPAASSPSVEGRAAVKVPPDRAQLLGIRSVPVGSGFTGGTVRTVGRVAMDERRREVVHAKYEGYVEKLLVDFTGKPVRKGQPLLAIYSPALVAAQKEYLVARGAQTRLGDSSVPGVAKGGAELAEASRQRLRSFDVGPEEIAALEKTGLPRRTVTLRSPVSGVVIEKTAVEGMKVSPTDRLYEIADLSHVWILAEVYEKDLGAVRVGLPARVTLASQPGGEWRGSVTFVCPTVKPDTRTVEARIDVDNAGGVLKPDMFVDVSLEGAPSAALTVPESAVIPTGERTLVFVDKGDGQYEPREVALGARVAGGYEVRQGLAAGDRVVVSANFLLDSESSLRAAIARTTGGR
jgi:Cu(I)/Ag(I) efflux system membrane fusion protein